MALVLRHGRKLGRQGSHDEEEVRQGIRKGHGHTGVRKGRWPCKGPYGRNHRDLSLVKRMGRRILVVVGLRVRNLWRAVGTVGDDAEGERHYCHHRRRLLVLACRYREASNLGRNAR